MTWKLILHGNETYPFPLSIHTDDDAEWIARDGTVSSLDHARLIAAAPDLLDALKTTLETFSLGPLGAAAKYGPDFDLRGLEADTLTKAHDAIAKAEGKSGD